MKFSEWKIEHPTAYKRAKFILIGVALAFVLLGVVKVARGAAVVCSSVLLTNDKMTCETSTIPPVDPPPVVVPPVTNCPAGTTIYTGGGKDMVLTFTQGQFNVFRFTVPTTGYSTKTLTSQFAPHLGGGTFAWAVSPNACDTSPANAVVLVGQSGTVYPQSKSAGASGSGFGFSLKVNADPAKGNLVPGKTYFVNVQATACGSCGLIADIVVP